MELTQAIILALVQGITEFLPISSSAHLILLPKALNWPDQQLVFDVAVHLGTLTAVIFHYRNTLLSILLQNPLSPNPSSAVLSTHYPILMLALASIPVFVCAYLFEPIIASDLRLPIIIAIATIGFGLLLWFADSHHSESRQTLSTREAIIIGLMQALALIPGTSRAGITLTAGLLLGFSRTQAAHFSFLLAIPVIGAAALYEGMKISTLETPAIWPMLGIGFIISAITAFATIRIFLKLILYVGLMPFVIYRLVLGIILLVLFW